MFGLTTIMLPDNISTILDQYSVEDIQNYLYNRIDGISLQDTHSEITNMEEDIEETEQEEDDEICETLVELHHEAITYIVEQYVKKYASEFKNYQYMSILLQRIYDVIQQEHEDIMETFLDEEDQLKELIQLSLNTIIGGHIPLRSRSTYTPYLSPQEQKQLSQQIKWIEEQPQPPQRTPEWYKFRHDLITASSAWKLLDTVSQQNSYVYDKCQELDVSRFERTAINTPFHWGHKYEPLAVLYYEDQYKTKVADFGCIRHATDHHIGASPDGINVDPTSGRYGRMLEIKNIVNREITGIPKKEYWIQMQLQMEVCQLDECDFLECRFKEYDSEDEYLADGLWMTTPEGYPKGVFLMFNHVDSAHPHYEYPPRWKMEYQEWVEWEKTVIATKQQEGWEWNHTIYWKLEEVSCVLVERNPWWYEAVRDEFKKWGEVIKQERIDGCEHRISKKRRENRENREKQQPTTKQEKFDKGFVLTISTDDL